MKNFVYKAPERQAEIEYIRKKQKQRIAKQQVIFISLFLLFVAGLVYYIGYKQYYLEFPGNVHVNVQKIRAVGDLIVFDMNKEIGDVVVPGDTVFSYMYLDYLLEQENVNREVDVLINYRKTMLDFEEASNGIRVKKSKIAKLKEDIAEEVYNIQLGISTNMYKLDLERQLLEVEADLRAQENVLELLRKQLQDVNMALEKSSIENPNIQMQYLTHLRKKDFNSGVVHFYVASDSAVVTSLSAARRSRIFRSEDIIYMQPLDANLSNIYISAYVPFEDVKYCTRGTSAELVVSNEISLEAYVAVQGAEAVKLPPNLQSNFTRKIMVNQTIFRLKKGQYIPFWCLSEGTPVTVRIRKPDVKRNSKMINIHILR
ncbi:hypothetical protein [Phocaeicola sp.]|uniref:hypothetical protein n=1 Tax=Phocaeicola sp. TaxID=2773926 RepID=UPI003A92BF34